MNTRHHMAVTLVIGMAGAPVAAADTSPDIDLYASFRLQAEAVQPGDDDELAAYGGFRDAYSRIGIKGGLDLGESLRLHAQLELPLDLANGRVQDPYDQDEDMRIAQIGLQGGFGNLVIGQMWMPYYNAIAYPVDMFSTYYSGFATYTTFRKGETVSYYSPEFGGVSLAGAWSADHGATEDDDRVQLTASYGFGDTTLAAGMDRLSDDWRILGLSLMHRIGDLYVGAKYERHDSELGEGYGADGDAAVNLFLSYASGPRTYKAMLANVEGYGETIFHLGMDHRVNDALALFAEYYQEQETAAITRRRGGAADTVWTADGGRVLAIGARYDF